MEGPIGLTTVSPYRIPEVPNIPVVSDVETLHQGNVYNENNQSPGLVFPHDSAELRCYNLSGKAWSPSICVCIETESALSATDLADNNAMSHNCPAWCYALSSHISA